MLKLKTLVIFTIVFCSIISLYYVLGKYNYSIYSKYSYQYSPKSNYPELIIDNIKKKNITELKYIHCGFTGNYDSRQYLDNLFDKYWERIKNYDWSNAIINPSDGNGFVVDNVKDNNGKTRSERFERSSSGTSYFLVYEPFSYFCFFPNYDGNYLEQNI